MFVAAGSAAAGSLSELSWTTEPDILMTHADQILRLSSSETMFHVKSYSEMKQERVACL